ncbi:sensor histidine kinase [Echinicola strongylocentroti]|uniref:histidine kinase n=1 Tax=Echinicola strongylocentroti TaxID=1795355 RepID=A0A2Z4IHS6_9BACT|nr:HAMP domain-containing sensor histidine kinase [Echinicola strongylocentroti]AWW30681.1 sensor histidine kinase [Echinicola strongylocentroti]
MEIIIRNLRKIKRVIMYVVMVALFSLMADAYVEWKMDNHPMLYIKNLINIAIIIIAVILCRFRFLTIEHVLMVVVYSIFVSIYISVPIRLGSGSLLMEAYFVKVELITLLLMLVAGILIHRRHMIYILLINGAFIISCMLILPVDYPMSKYIFYLVLSTGAGLAGHQLQKELSELRESLTRANEKVARHNEELIESNKQKDHLFRIIGHDIRTPFNQISMVLSLITREMSHEGFEDMKNVMFKAVENGNRLLQDLMLWAKSQAAESKAVMDDVLIHDLIQKEVNFFEGQAKSKDIVINNLINKNVKITADPNMTATIIRNFISNALKFSYRNTSIDISMNKTSDYNCLSVSDYGAGMKASSLEDLLHSERNVVSSDGTEKESGTGFGVRICQKLAEHQGGRVEIDSDLGKGSTFSLLLPKIQPQGNVKDPEHLEK